MPVPFEKTSLTATIGGIDITMETGRMANQADGAVWIQSGGTVVLVTACSQTLDIDRGFFPLTCNYQEMFYAAGRIPGSYFRREVGRPSERETLISRLIDRPLRPLFPKGFKDETQIIATVLSADRHTSPDVLALTGASAALHISSIPWGGPIACARVGYVDGSFVLFPTYKGMADNTDLNLVLAATRDAVVMVEGAAKFLPEDLIAEAIEWGHKQILPLIDMQEELRAKVGKPKRLFTPPLENKELVEAVFEFARADMAEALAVTEKMPRRAAMQAVRTKAREALAERFVDDLAFDKHLSEALDALEKQIVREKIRTTGRRIDGRDLTTVRPLSIEVGLLPQAHGSSLFRRGETSALCVTTLGSSRDEQRIETLTGETTKNFMLHYNFPPYCVGEARMLRAPSRREVGHGNLAERALLAVMPENGEFPFTVRVVSEVMESNGSSSMASVCGGCLALMDAGVPIKAPVAGIAMGLCKVGDEFFVLTDILGDEDALGDMDFKLAGTAEGITAVQMDIKISGIPKEVLRRALLQSRDARLHILSEMSTVLETPRENLSDLAPQYKTVVINPEKIREVIGSGGKNIKAITAATEADIDIEDTGHIKIFAPTLESLKKAEEMILYYDQTAEVGANYAGKVIKIIDCGAIVEILPGLEGLLHVSQLDVERVENVSDLLAVGQEVMVKVVEVQPGGRVRLSRKAWLMEQAGQEVDLSSFSAPRGGGGRGGDRCDRGGRGGDRGGRGGDRGGRR
ncbi:Polyribonucleotide nucleotidyltransferase [Alkalidesulfovibrio alkalitolerans DSM 16529]|uniref:Polyribonucleotide nucleotidyltransferase n=1 Tax=Alkalidesulfovibrio alkalitolerans DSM 16529 TaxID=1121439 RepID=S7URN8_9BACT|nr:polyribonucleotide nucleotidyltransferase [Alkalidesulfovibrio alkalitolerans]EPR34978.1 Polyribonucleotide nucleotidyltransferase [Alkalidesulfovibrio alkalitolerans DSM 16529]